jgi:hypothetical protein
MDRFEIFRQCEPPFIIQLIVKMLGSALDRCILLYEGAKQENMEHLAEAISVRYIRCFELVQNMIGYRLSID